MICNIYRQKTIKTLLNLPIFQFVSCQIFGGYNNRSVISKTKIGRIFCSTRTSVRALPFCVLHPVLDFTLWNVETYQMKKVLNSKGQPVLNLIYIYTFQAYGIAILTTQFRRFTLFLIIFDPF